MDHTARSDIAAVLCDQLVDRMDAREFGDGREHAGVGGIVPAHLQNDHGGGIFVPLPLCALNIDIIDRGMLLPYGVKDLIKVLGYMISSTTIRITSTMITQSYIPAPAAIPMHAELNSPAAVVSPVTC